MIALLRYLWLKSLRDSSLVGFVITPTLVPVAALAGVSLAARRFSYPFYLNAHYRPVDNAALASTLSMGMAIIFAGITAFWVLRSEIASRSVNAFLFGLRPAGITLVLVVFGTAVALVGWLAGLTVSCLLTAAVPPDVLLFGLKSLVGFVAASAVGAFAVALSPQPATMVGTYCGGVFLMVFIEKAGPGQQMALVAAIAIGCAVLATVLLERRCAA